MNRISSRTADHEDRIGLFVNPVRSKQVSILLDICLEYHGGIVVSGRIAYFNVVIIENESTTLINYGSVNRRNIALIFIELDKFLLHLAK